MTKILVIEDNDYIGENIVEILELSGFTAFWATNGNTGIELALQHTPDLILCDIMMPQADGYTVLETLSSHPQLRAIPFIFLTAKAERSDIRRGMKLGADDYLTKPFDDVELLRAVESRLKRKEVHQLFYGKTPQHLNALLSQGNGMATLKSLMRDRDARLFKKNQVIHHEGDRVIGIYFIMEGKVKTVKVTENGHELITGMYKADDYLDLNIILSKDTYKDTSIVMEDTTLSFLPGEQLDKLLFMYPDVGAKFIKILTDNIQEKELRLIQVAYLSVRKRVAETLIKLLEHHSPDGISIKISREDLASLCGTVAETVSRTLSDFKDEGILEKSGSNLSVMDISRLKKVRN